MRRATLAVGLALFASLIACTKTEQVNTAGPSTTGNRATTSTPSEESDADATTSTRSPRSTTKSSTRTSGTQRTTSTTEAASEGGSGPMKLNTWKATKADGPLAAGMLEGGTAYCSFNRKGNFWQLNGPDDAPFGSVGMLFEDPSKPNEPKLEVTTPGNKGTLATGVVSTSTTQGDGNVISFSASGNFRSDDGTTTGTFELQGACLQEKPKG